ncbi:NAD(P)-dependent oxidoreductase [Orrella sp. JC864]|uniref:NAD(P)-dependent oxidoreductase n=1 Tax=Orrella sp. JC864 TaxID=3120298 RepID=UPI003008DC5C
MSTPSLAPVRVGFIGLGVMGRGMAASLMRAGHALTVHNRNAQAVEPYVAQGAQAAATPAELARACGVVFLCLSDTAAVEQVLFGPQGLAQGAAKGTIVIDTSTISAQAARQFAARLAQQGASLLDAPVSGGQQGAAEGKLSCMVGGGEQAFQAALPYLQGIASRIVRVGESGAGQVAKACNQVAVTGAMLGVAEAFALARRHGVDVGVVREALLGGAARSAVLEKNALRLIERDFEPGFRTRLMRKDLRLALQAGQDGGAFMPMAALALQLMESACNAGDAEADWSALARWIESCSTPAARDGG